MSDLAELSDAELARRAVAVMHDDPEHDRDESWAFVRALQRRGNQPVFQQAGAWCASPDAGLRRLGANVLGQLGAASGHPFASASTPILEGLLADPDESVVSSALVALGHLGVGDIATICALASSPSDLVRYKVAWCLGMRDDDPLALTTLLALTRDSDAEVRDWATFGVGTLFDADGPDIRQALVDRLDDSDAETRGEAMVGLARRGDTRADAAIAAAASDPSAGALVHDAAEIVAARRAQDDPAH
jgi:HEAT repeat protein